ncbi:MAG: hypothetical protein K8I30_21025, partial [Anaerolineae bacterium]|nr:hypothetical protein [Anaerolineae bacterium]
AFEILPGSEVTRAVSLANPLTLTTVNQSTPAGALTFSWTVVFDGTGATICSDTTENISCDLTEYGSYTITLQATAGGNTSVMTRSLTINAPAPSATFSLDPSSGVAPLNITITPIDNGTGPIDTWSWDFDGDGNEDANNSTAFARLYSTPGTYTIALRYDGPGGYGTVSQTFIVFAAVEALIPDFTYASNGGTPTSAEVCFTNTSTGPYDYVEWDFDADGNVDSTSLASPICWTYTTSGLYEVSLYIENSDEFATVIRNVTVTMGPIAAFTISPGTTVNAGTTLNLDSSGSSGVITSYEWDWDGNLSTIESTQANPSISNLPVGTTVIRLTVRGPGGSSHVEQSVLVNQLTLTCDIGGNFNVLPTAGAQNYTSSMGNLNGRTVSSYDWRIDGSGTGLPITGVTSQNLNNINWAV